MGDRKYKPCGKHRNSRGRQLGLGVISKVNSISIVQNQTLVFPEPSQFQQPLYRQGKWYYTSIQHPGKIAFNSNRDIALFCGGAKYKYSDEEQVVRDQNSYQFGAFHVSRTGNGVHLCSENPIEEVSYIRLLQPWDIFDGICTNKFLLHRREKYPSSAFFNRVILIQADEEEHEKRLLPLTRSCRTTVSRVSERSDLLGSESEKPEFCTFYRCRCDESVTSHIPDNHDLLDSSLLSAEPVSEKEVSSSNFRVEKKGKNASVCLRVEVKLSGLDGFLSCEE